MTEPNASVSDGKQTGSVADNQPATPASTEGVAQATPNQPSGDEGAKLAELQRSYDKAQTDLQRYQQDINAMKSASQKKEYELTQQIEDLRSKYDSQLMSLMDDETRTEYENATRASRLRELEQKAIEAQERLQQQQAVDNAFFTFLEKGVPMDVLMQYRSEGAEAMAGAAWDWLFNRPVEQKPAPSAQTPATPTTKPPEAPNVVTTTSEAPYAGPAWDALVEKYGSEDDVFMAIETGSLPPDVSPLYRAAKRLE